MKKLYSILFVITFLLSCTENSEQTKETNASDTINITAVNTIINFYKWYRNNQNIQQCLVGNSCGEIFDSTKLYSVDFKATEKYLATLKNTGYISDKYISYWRDYFKECSENFKKNRAYDGPPEGFDYDFITNSQDFELELNTVEKAKISKVIDTNDKKTITLEFITGNKISFELSQIANKWYIDKIK